MRLPVARVTFKWPASTSLRLLTCLLAFGLASVLYWAAFDDLRLYILAQFYPILTIPLVLWRTPAPYTRGGDWLTALGFYAVAKALEELDGAIYLAAGLVSGHTLKHLAAAAGAFVMVRMLMRRRALE